MSNSTFESLKKLAVIGCFVVFICGPLPASAYSTDDIYNSYIEALSHIENQLADVIVLFQNYSASTLAQVAVSPTPTVQIWADPGTTSGPGKSTKLIFWPKNATSCVGSGFDPGSSVGYTTVYVSPTKTTSYFITCAGPGGSVTAGTRVYVGGSSTSVTPTATLSIDQSTIIKGSSTSLSWVSTNAASCIGTEFSTGNNFSGSVSVAPATTTTYSVACGGATQSVTVTVLIPPTIMMWADPAIIQDGQSTKITYSPANATSCISSGLNGSSSTGYTTVSITPHQTADYSVTCTGSGGSVTKTVKVTVLPPATVATTTPQTSITYPILIEAGNNSNYVDSKGRTWQADTKYVDPSWGGIVDRGSIAISNTSDSRIYQTERWCMNGYAIPVDNGVYTVKLHFAETSPSNTSAGKRIFDYSVEGQSESNFDVIAQAGGFATALIKTYTTTVTDNILNITFTRHIDCPEINGIEISQYVAPVTSMYPKGPKFGFFFGGIWGTTATTIVQKYESDMNRKVELIDQFDGENSAWTGNASIASSAGWLISQANAATLLTSPRRMVFALHLGILKPSGTTTTQAQFDKQNFAEIAAGLHDNAYLSVGNNLVKYGFDTAYIRLGQEGNGSYFPGCACSDKAGFVAAWNHVAALLYSIPGNHFEIGLDFATDRSVTTYTTGIDWSLVKFINLDIYNWTWSAASQATSQTRWSYNLSHGINEWLALGKSTGKPLAVFEWATGGTGGPGSVNGGDDTYFIDKMWEMITNPANNIIASVYWQNSSGYPGTLSDTKSPNAWAEYKLKFGGSNPPMNGSW